MIQTKICAVCGKEFAPSRAWSVYCSKECAAVKARERVRESNARRRKYSYIVVKPVTKTSRELSDIALLASEERLSYGQYVAKYLWKGM